MEADYNQLTGEIDAREILRYLNHLGIHNISGEALKYFITDLKKLIKYDLEQRYKSNQTESEKQGPERLHSASTFCSRSRSKSQTEIKKCSRECNWSRKPLIVRNIQSAPVLGSSRNVEEKVMRRACSCNIEEKRSETTSRLSRPSTSGTSNNLIKVPRPPVKKKCDPVSLYHYYTSLWTKYKSKVPGENDWADLRWNIRQKMAGSIPQQVESKTLASGDKAKENVRSVNTNSRK